MHTSQIHIAHTWSDLQTQSRLHSTCNTI